MKFVKVPPSEGGNTLVYKKLLQKEGKHGVLGKDR